MPRMWRSGSAPARASSAAAAVSALPRSGGFVILFSHSSASAVVAFRTARASAMSSTPVKIT